MALVVKDRVQQFTTTTGTGTITLSGAVAGFQDFSVIGDGNTTYYTITDGTDWEVGIGTYTSSGTTLSRDTILESSNSGSAVNWGAGSKNVFVTYPAERSMYVDGTAITPATTARLGFSNLAQGSALSVLGVTGNATADNASIAAGTDHQVLRRSGTSVSFGAVALNQANAVTGALPFDNGGTGQTTQQAAMNALAGAITSGQYLRGNGTNVTMSALAAADMTGTISVANGGTGASTLTANNVILGNGTSAVQFVAPGTSGNVLTSNGTTWESQPAGGSSFPASTRMLFAQSTAPTGWTKDTVNYNQHALRVVTGTAGTGGTVDFTTAFASQTPTGNIAVTIGQTAQAGNITVSTGQTAAPGSTGNAASPNGNTTLGIPTIPAHKHPTRYSINRNINSIYDTRLSNTTENSTDSTSIQNTGGGGAHTHPAGNHTHPFTGGQHAHPASGTFTGSQHNHPAPGTFTGSAINLAVKYLDVITATKD